MVMWLILQAQLASSQTSGLSISDSIALADVLSHSVYAPGNRPLGDATTEAAYIYLQVDLPLDWMFACSAMMCFWRRQ